jgi:CheY-like chemotaxis protein
MGDAKVILVVEDEPTVRGLIADMLEISGYKCVVASNAVDAMRIIEAGVLRFDLLLSDVMMPGGLSGVDLAMRIRQIDPATRLLLISGYVDEKLTAAAAAAGIRVIPKPFRQKDLDDAVREVLESEMPPNVLPIRRREPGSP